MAWWLAAAGVGLSLIGGSKRRKARRREAEQRMRLARMKADLRWEQFLDDAKEFERQLRQYVGKQKAMVGASGVTMAGGPMTIIQETLRIGEEDLQTMYRNADREIRFILSGGEMQLKAARDMNKADFYSDIGNAMLSFGSFIE